jgi:ribose transport system ATP-binding protein
VKWFFSLVNKLKQRGKTIIFVTHRHGEMREFCDTLTVLRNGRTVGTFPVADVTASEVVRLMIGRSLEATYPPKRQPRTREVALEAVSLGRPPSFRDANLTVRRGEIVGVAGLAGHGQRELFLSLFGVARATQGDIRINGAPVRIRSPRDAISAGVGISLVPEDRKTEGLFLKLPVTLNMAFPSLGRLSSFGWIRNGEVREAVKRTAGRLNISQTALRSEARALSGGNQQKVVIGKWVLAGAKYLLLYDPTRGVDVGTKVEIYRLMQELADEGISILFYSSEVPEIAEMADRVYVFYKGRIVAELEGDDQTEETILSAMIGHGDDGSPDSASHTDP